jgi:parallel beta-helix repeat protein
MCGSVRLLLVLSVAFGCGGGGGGSEGGAATTYYVRAGSGVDGNDGLTPDTAFQTIGAAVEQIGPGATVIVGPGTYNEAIVDPPSGSASQPVRIVADPAGAQTGDPLGRVVINAIDAVDDRDPPRRLPAVRISRGSFITIDGFILTRGGGAGVQVRAASEQITIENCEIFGNSGDGVLLQDSSAILIFNNLIYDNSARGIVVGGMTDTRVINNTIVRNGRGLQVVTRDEIPSRQTFVRNNVLQANGTNIEVDDSVAGFLDEFDSAFNLVFPETYVPLTVRHPTDINSDAQFIDFRNDNFRLSEEAAGEPLTSPAVGGGIEEQPETAPLADFEALRERTTASDGALDGGALNMGYHYRPDDELPPERPPILYVRAVQGDDTNSGRSPDEALATIGAASNRAINGDTIVVGPGNYGRILEPIGVTEADPIIFQADPSGDLTGDASGPVVLDGEDVGSVVRITDTSFITIDGFTIVGGRTAGVQVRGDSSNITIQNCEISGTGGDGILVQDSFEVLLFNNLVHRNLRRGLAAAGSPRVSMINNTVALNGDRGVFITSRESEGQTSPSTSGFLRNNIIQDNELAQLQVGNIEPSSLPGYSGDFNLVFPENYVPSEIRGEADINEDAMFSGPGDGDFRLLQPRVDPSAAVDAGVEENAPFGPAADFSLLRDRTTSPNGREDRDQLDLGFHYLR